MYRDQNVYKVYKTVSVPLDKISYFIDKLELMATALSTERNTNVS